jgi:hypothetical protein
MGLWISWFSNLLAAGAADVGAEHDVVLAVTVHLGGIETLRENLRKYN